MDTADLIKTVRGLDQTGPGSDGENLQLLWSSLAAASDSQFHAAEESSLRWLLKSMNTSSPAAEALRRYPLTWTILDCVFQRIPLFSLAKSLADRKFIAVLQQTLKDVSTPLTGSGSPASPKRKRTPTVSYALNDLRAHSGCVETARAVFDTLKSLLNRLEDPETNLSRHKIGAEHIKSLFCISSADAAILVASALAVCSNLLASDTCGKVDGAQDWIKTTSMIWDLHLQGSDDSLDVATHLFKPSANILSMIGAFSTHEIGVPEILKSRWKDDLEKFMHRNFILPGRAAFVNRRTFETFTKALQVAEDMIQQSAPALYFLSSGVSSRVTEGELRKDNVEWIKQIFQAVELAIRGRVDRSTPMQTILDQAVQRSTPIDVEDLRRVCREYALQGAETDWELVAKVATCDSDVFQLSQEGADLRREICDRTMTRSTSEGDHKAILVVIEAIMDGFRTRRDFSGFLRLWFEQLCQAEQQKLDLNSPWFEVARRKPPKQALGTLIEAEMSAPQLVDAIAWAETKKPKKHPHSICVFSSTICQALRTESFVDAVGRRLFDLVGPVGSSSGTAALKWRVVSKTFSWVTQDDRLEIWFAVKDKMSKTLKTSPIMSGETFEAFKCSYQIWDSMSPDGEHINEPASFIQDFTTRLAAELAKSGTSDGASVPSVWPDMEAELQEQSVFQQYLAWYLHGSSRFNKLYYGKYEEVPSVLSNALSTRSSSADELQTLWHAVLRNEINLNDSKLARDVIDRLIAALEDSEKEKGWPGERGQMWIKTLAGLPLDAYNRGQREKLMAVLSKRQAKMKSSKRVSQDGWKLVLGLATKVMSRPTFYDGMDFSNLVDIAEAVSSISPESSTSSGTGAALELVERFSLLASATIRQMAEHIQERSVDYFRQASKFVSVCNAQALEQQYATMTRRPLYMTLLKALTRELSRSPHCRSHEVLGPLLQASKEALASCIKATIGNVTTDKKLLSAREIGADMSLFAAVDAAQTVGDLGGLLDLKSSAVRKLEKRSKDMMQQGDLRGWKIQIFLRKYSSSEVEVPRPVTYDSLESLPSQLREPLLGELVTSVLKDTSSAGQFQYLKDLLQAFSHGSDTDGQVLAIQTVVCQLIDSADFQGQFEGFNLGAAHSELTASLLKKSPNTTHVCRILRILLEKRPQAMSQWNIELTLNTVCSLTSAKADQSSVPFSWLCKLVEVIIKKHRLRLEGHYHLLLSTMQALLRNLVVDQASPNLDDKSSQESKAHQYTRLITLICEPTAGAVSRSQMHSALDSATDAAKRSAGRHMYMVLMQYVKLQLEESVPREVREALEPAMNSIFDITSPEGRKILNDAMDSSGRAILREMFKRYVKFGKWSGV